MARVTKIDNAFKKRFERKEQKRKINIREYRLYYLIVCEGEKTEPNYFESLRKELPVGVLNIEIEGTGRNTSSLVDYTIKIRGKSIKNYDKVWAVFDKDSFPNKNFNDAIAKAEANNINCAWSNEAFELWFLLHFQFVNNAMNRDNYKAYLEREIKRKTGNKLYKYKKNAKDTYLLLEKYGDKNQAIIWAKELKNLYSDQKFHTHNPCTLVYKLIEELLSHQIV